MWLQVKLKIKKIINNKRARMLSSNNFSPKNHKAIMLSSNNFSPKNRKAVSIMIGYILLVTAAVVMGVIVYQWLKTYVPKEALECPSDVSIFIKEYICQNNELNLTLQNNGKFSIAGYFIHVKNESGQKLAIIDLSQKLIISGEEKNFTGAVRFSGGEENTFKPANETTHKFNLIDIGNIYFVEISPARFQEVENEKRFANCGNSKIEEEISCSL